MKRIISLIIALCLVLGSFSFAFATATEVSDAQTHTLLNGISSLISGSNGVNAYLQRIANYLYAGSGMSTGTIGYYIYNSASYLYDIREYASQIASSVSGSGSSGLAAILNSILAEFTSTSTGGAITHFFQGIYQNTSNIYNRLGTIVNSSFPNLRTDLATLHSDSLNINNNLIDILTDTDSIDTVTNSTLPGIYAYSGSIDGTTSAMYAIDQLNGMNAFSNGTNVTVFGLASNGHEVSNVYDFSGYNWRVNTGRFLQYINNNLVRAAAFLTDGFNNSQTYTTWNGSTLSTATFTPISTTNGVYSWLSNIQTPLARLAFVHASDQEIEARLLAEDNQQAVVDDFIDPSGTGSVGVSDFGSLSDASGAMKMNFNTGQSASGVFNVFDDQHFGYLSQGTADSLDTSGSNTRLLKASGSEYPTPTLDRYYEELNKILEVNSDD